MTVHCPHCGTGYLLPDHLLGPRGARVRCPNCRRPFVVLREEASAGRTSTASPPPAAGEIAPSTIATEAPARTAAAAESPPDGIAEVTREPEAPPTPATRDAQSMASEILDALAQRLGPRVAEAKARGRVLAELGPELMKAYDEFRARAGDDAPREAFRAVLRERWGVDLL